MFPHGIPDGISTFIIDIIDKLVIPAVESNEFPSDVLNIIFSFVPKFLETEYKVVHGIPDSISTFIIDTISKFKNNNNEFPRSVLKNFFSFVPKNNEFPRSVLKNIFSFVPKSLKTEYTVVLVGDRGVGRGEFVKALRDLFNCDPVFDHSTNKTEVTLRMDTNYGATTFNIHVFSGLERHWHDDWVFLADCAILMFDVTSRATFMDVPNWHRDVVRVCENIPIVICGNYAEKKNSKITYVRKMEEQNRIKYVAINTRKKTNCEKPFLLLANWLNGDCFEHPKLKFINHSLSNSEEEVAAARQP